MFVEGERRFRVFAHMLIIDRYRDGNDVELEVDGSRLPSLPKEKEGDTDFLPYVDNNSSIYNLQF